MAEIVIRNSHVLLVSREGSVRFAELISNATVDYSVDELKFLVIELKRAAVDVEEQIVRIEYENKKGL